MAQNMKKIRKNRRVPEHSENFYGIKFSLVMMTMNNMLNRERCCIEIGNIIISII